MRSGGREVVSEVVDPSEEGLEFREVRALADGERGEGGEVGGGRRGESGALSSGRMTLRRK